MTDTNPPNLPPVIEEDLDIPETPAPSPAPKDIEEAKATGYAVYDETLQRYASGVLTTKKDAQAAAKTLPEAHAFTIVRV